MTISSCALILEGRGDLLFFDDDIILLVIMLERGVRLLHRGAKHITVASLGRRVGVDVLSHGGPRRLCLDVARNAKPRLPPEGL